MKLAITVYLHRTQQMNITASATTQKRTISVNLTRSSYLTFGDV